MLFGLRVYGVLFLVIMFLVLLRVKWLNRLFCWLCFILKLKSLNLWGWLALKERLICWFID